MCARATLAALPAYEDYLWIAQEAREPWLWPDLPQAYAFPRPAGELVSIVPDARAGREGRRRRIRPARYLKSWCGLAESDARERAKEYALASLPDPWDSSISNDRGCDYSMSNSPSPNSSVPNGAAANKGRPAPTLQFASTPEEIVEVYRAGPHSCIADFPPEVHPARVYGAGDLAVAWLGDGARTWARALVWPARRVYGRVYPADVYHLVDGYRNKREARAVAAALERRLRAAGYRPDRKVDAPPGMRSTPPLRFYAGFEGARLLVVGAGAPDLWLMPPLDHGYEVVRDGTVWRMVHERAWASGPEPRGDLVTGTMVWRGEGEGEEK